MRTLIALLCLTVAIIAACGDDGDTKDQGTPGANNATSNGTIITTPRPR